MRIHQENTLFFSENRNAKKLLFFAVLFLSFGILSLISTIQAQELSEMDLTLTESEETDTESFDVSGLLAGDWVSKTYRIHVSHSDPVYLVFSLSLINEESLLHDVMRLRVTDQTNQKPICEGSFRELNQEKFSMLLDPTQDEIDYLVEIGIPEEADPADLTNCPKADFIWQLEKAEETVVSDTAAADVPDEVSQEPVETGVASLAGYLPCLILFAGLILLITSCRRRRHD